MGQSRRAAAIIVALLIASSCGTSDNIATDGALAPAAPPTTAPILAQVQPTIAATGGADSTTSQVAPTQIPAAPTQVPVATAPPAATAAPLPTAAIAAPTAAPTDEVAGTAQTAPARAGGTTTAEEAEMLAAHNAIRAETGVAPLVWNAEIAAASAVWSQSMARNNALQHDPNIFTVPGKFNAENISQQLFATSPTSVVGDATNGWASTAERDAFVRSQGCPGLYDDQGRVCGHYKNIIDPSLTQLGCGVTDGPNHRFWVCRFRI